MIARFIFLFFILITSFLFIVNIKELHLRLYGTLMVEGSVMSIIPPSSDNSWIRYDIEYKIEDKIYMTQNGSDLSQIYRVGDRITLIVNENDYTHSIVKDSYLWLTIGIIFCLFIDGISIYAFVNTFLKN